MLTYLPGDAFLGSSGSGQGGNAEAPQGTLSKALERIGRTDESLFLLTNASSMADRRKQGASAIAASPSCGLTKIQPYGKPSKFIGKAFKT
jgi:hypothetical protein